MGEHTGKWCNVHDITREVILSRFDELGFCQVLDKNGKKFKGKARWLSIPHSTTKDVFNDIGYNGVHSFFSSIQKMFLLAMTFY